MTEYRCTISSFSMHVNKGFIRGLRGSALSTTEGETCFYSFYSSHMVTCRPGYLLLDYSPAHSSTFSEANAKKPVPRPAWTYLLNIYDGGLRARCLFDVIARLTNLLLWQRKSHATRGMIFMSNILKRVMKPWLPPHLATSSSLDVHDGGEMGR